MEAERQNVSVLTGGGIEVGEAYALRRKEPPGAYKNGFRFRMVAVDQTGEIEIYYWGGRDETLVRQVYDGLKEGSIIKVVGVTGEWRGRICINVNPAHGGSLGPAVPGDFDPSEFVPCSDKDPEELFKAMWSYVETMEDASIRSLLVHLFTRPGMSQEFKRSPASVSYHCAWVGGLVEHTLNVLRICDSVSRTYPQLDRDLLLAGAVLHDLGKVRCYDVTSTITESVDGRMMGHLVIGAHMVKEACESLPGFPENLQRKLLHMVLASHGSNENGSPAEPAIPEALALNYADELDANLERFILARERGGPGDLFVLDAKLGTKVYTQ